VNIALTALAALYGGVFVVSGTGQITDWGLPRTPAAACGFSLAACRSIGVLELLGGVGLLTARFVTGAAVVAASGLFLLTSAAFLYHDAYDARRARLWAPAATAVVMLCIAVGLPVSSVD
jgi:uncharacterized membrane protein YphA (DoxX/SURF4 family)